MARSTSRPSSHKARANGHNGGIDKLEYRPGGRPLLPPDDHQRGESSGRQSEERSYAGSFLNEVAEGIAEEDRKEKTREVMRYVSFFWAVVNCLCAGSITAYSLYAPLFQKRLHYSQLQVNGVSITAELALYLPVPLWGIICDRYGPGWPSLFSGGCFGVGYILAAFAYRSGAPPSSGGEGWPYWVMIVCFVLIGSGTSCMYLSAVTTCAKNFGRGRYKGLALAVPIACFGLGSMWQAQVATHLLYEVRPDGSKGEIDVFRFFIFLGVLLVVVGLIGSFLLRIVDEEEFIDEAVEELERSGLLQESQFFRRTTSSYGTISNGGRRLSEEEIDEINREAEEHKARLLEEKRKKAWLLNEETRRFLADPNMWWLAAGFLLVTGPGEAFINNMGTVIDTLYPAVSVPEKGARTNAVTHVSIVAITSTVSRILTGTLTDVLAPTSPPHQHRRGPSSILSLENSTGSLPRVDMHTERFQVSRIVFMIGFALLMSIGQVVLASGALQGHGNLFWIVSASIGTGYGAAFSLTPIVISVVWGVENFGTNWGIVATASALGATIFGLLYSWVYQGAALRETTGLNDSDDILCYGKMCYSPTFWAMALSVWVACGLWLWAWRGPKGWFRRGILV